MPNPELNISQAEQTNAKNSELSGSILRQINQVRGEKTYEAERSQRDKETLERIAKLRQELEAIHKKKIELGILSPDTPFVFNEEDYIPTKSSPNLSTAQSAKTSVAPELPSSPAQKNTEPASAEEGEPLNTSPNHVVLAQTNSEAAIANSEKDSQQAEKNEFKEKLKKKSGLKKVLTAVAAVVLAGIIVAGTWLGINSSKRQNNSSDNIQTSPSATEMVDTGENQEAKGIYDGYGEKGMWLSGNKGGNYDFASAKEVAEVCDNDEREMIKYTAKNQVESFADYLANLPGELQPDGFKGLTILETEDRLEKLSDKEYDAILEKFNGIIDSAFTRDKIVNGEQQNAYMRLKNSNGSVVHSNMELVACTTYENNLNVRQLYWANKDGKEIGSITIKLIPVRNVDGNIIRFKGCEQIIGGNNYIYKDMPKITENPTETPTEPSTETPTEPSTENPTETPTEVPTETPTEPSAETPTEAPSEVPTETPTETPTEPPTQPPTEKPAPKNTEAEKENAGPRVDQQPLSETVTPQTTLEEDQANFDQIREQQKEDATRAAEAERVAREQAERERQAAAEAERRRQEQLAVYEEAARQVQEAEQESRRRADEAAANAIREAEEAQRIAAEAERQAAAERAEREKAEAEAEVAAETMSSGAGEMGTYNLDERAELYDLYGQLFGGQ